MKISYVACGVLALVVINGCLTVDDLIKGCSMQKMELARYIEDSYWSKQVKGFLKHIHLDWIVEYEEPETDLCFLYGYELPQDPWIVSLEVFKILLAGGGYFLKTYFMKKKDESMSLAPGDGKALALLQQTGEKFEDQEEGILKEETPEETGLPSDLNVDITIRISIRNGKVISTTSQVD